MVVFMGLLNDLFPGIDPPRKWRQMLLSVVFIGWAGYVHPNLRWLL
jgi:hypothetical protein